MSDAGGACGSTLCPESEEPVMKSMIGKKSKKGSGGASTTPPK